MTHPAHPSHKLLPALLLAAACGSSMAAPVPISGLDPVAPYAVVTTADPYLKQQAFENLLVAGSLQTENFQSFTAIGDQSSVPPAPQLFSGLFGNVNNTLSTASDGNSAYVENRQIVGATKTGRFNTSTPTNGCDPTGPEAGGGCNWWETSQTFTLTFAKAVSAFGFYGTDVGDFDGSLSLTLFKQDGTEGPTLNVSGTGGGAAGSPASNSQTSSLLFYGFTDTGGDTYSQIRFNVGQASGGTTDFLGFDDLLIGDAARVTSVPEPASLALVAISLAGLAASRRSKRR